MLPPSVPNWKLEVALNSPSFQDTMIAKVLIVDRTPSCGIRISNLTSENTFVSQGSDGSSWTARTLPSSGNWRSVAFGNGVFVAIKSGTSIVARSTDGVNWTEYNLPIGSVNWFAMTYGAGLFVAVAESISTTSVTSPDGINWTARTLPAGSWQTVTFGNGTFVALSYGSGNAATSADGITWTQRTLPSSAPWRSIVYGNDIFVAIAFGSNVAVTSP